MAILSDKIFGNKVYDTSNHKINLLLLSEKNTDRRLTRVLLLHCMYLFLLDNDKNKLCWQPYLQ